ncbi:probable acyl-[acyl-carrier-protein]--UDP-N-acetylglucosamine O-acyltransferase, mitochondrial isoform X4 [Chenopodium quinoa]|uniref:probable acyl-[acyl-carrier-protein]--UDP-N-acetylglucosamine O-acyltransferase, mitochondrial isoform X4 n=1 Tax=Chenopodium quinoa TaxID=63459 RepID=UPI000B77DCF4|nr:probable acyl-[acyl-carrier-protein]--UDP-N-acetylglucosamine O-acyltransferase, mitochondrial isoform X4 [Chenopodium quinoa]
MRWLRKPRNIKTLPTSLLQLPSLSFLRPLSNAAADALSPTFVHPTAIVHPNATLGQGVSIGPFCTVGSSVKLGNACKLYPGSHIFGYSQLGDNCILMTNKRCDTYPSTLIQDGDECFLDIGDNNEIREYSSVHRSSKPDEQTIIGHNNLIMGSCHVAHDCKIGNNNILANNTLLAGHIVVEDYIHTAGAAVVHQYCHLGSFCFIGGGSVVSQDVPKFMMVSGDRAELRGLNLEGMRRRGFSATEIKGLRAAYRKIFMPTDTESGSIEDRLKELEQHEELGQLPVICSMVQSIHDSFSESRRGICKYRHWNAS